MSYFASSISAACGGLSSSSSSTSLDPTRLAVGFEEGLSIFSNFVGDSVRDSFSSKVVGAFVGDFVGETGDRIGTGVST
jgi:hypothetical protein